MASKDNTTVDQDFNYVTNSSYRINILFFLSCNPFACYMDIVNAVQTYPSYVTVVIQSLIKRDLIGSVKKDNHLLFFLTSKGECIVKQMSEFNGIE